ncbi:VOC family protein [Undibacterium sp. TJN25]|uniref:VOC family protein n=1 Tax=Undibacterium sp. TJN25 TaxID=3413056 RepID=UPI003BF2EF90
MPRCFLDHIAITAPTLEAGADYVYRALGVSPLPGGEHPRMGTHNMLLRLGETVYLEVIAINPAAEAPARPRWFGLDALTPESPPRLATWIARTADIHASHAASTEALGNIEPMSRGALNWQISVPQDGTPPLGGMAPALIQWETEALPPSRMPDLGLTLTRLELFHPEPQRIAALLRSLETDGLLSVSALAAGEVRYLVAHIDTPQGPRVLSGQ